MTCRNCECGHPSSEHRLPRRGCGNSGECRICLCEGFRKPPLPLVTCTDMDEYSRLQAGAAVMDWILERLERKSSPQGLNVMAEELQWLGQAAMTRERLARAVSLELKQPRPRIEAVAEEVYWVAGKCTPAGWSLFRDRRMLPCFYREYPPDIAWEDIDNPSNILPSPSKKPAERS